MNIEGPSVVPTDPHIVELDRLGDEIAELAAHLDAATARLLDLIREFDARGGWGHGFRSCAHWLSWRVGLEPGAAREHVRVARALGSLPQLREALARVATPETEERLVAVGRAGTAERVELIVRGWRRMDRKAEAQETTRRHRNRALHVYPDGDGMVLIRGRLEPEVGAVVMQALTAAREALSRRRRAEDVPAGTSVVDGSAEAPTMEQQQADALALVAEAALHRGMDPGAPDADAPGQSVLDGGARVPAGTSRRLACDASRVVMRHDADGRITEVWRAHAHDPARATARSSIATKAAASPVVVGCWVRAITSATGRTAARRRCPISRCSVADTIARSTKRVSRSSDWPMTSCASGGRTGGYYPMCRRRRPCPRIRWTRCERRMTQEGCTSTRARRRPAGRESDWTSDTPSASCTRWLWPAVDPSAC